MFSQDNLRYEAGVKKKLVVHGGMVNAYQCSMALVP